MLILTTTNSPASSVQRSFIPTPPGVTCTAYSPRVYSFSDDLLHGVNVSIFTRLEESLLVIHIARRDNGLRSTSTGGVTGILSPRILYPRL